MDVQCERCKTEYEFDDVLVSGRGTTVRCTHCGHQFKVRRPDAGEPTGDRWVVQTASGQQLTFLTLRELQRAILAKQVARSDMFLLAGNPARALGSITELEPFFEGRSSSRPPPAADRPGDGAAALSVPQAGHTQPFGTPPERSLEPAEGEPRGGTVPSTFDSAFPRVADGAPAVRTAARPSREDELSVPEGQDGSYARAIHPAPGMAFPPAVEETSSRLPPPTVPVRRSMPSGDDEVPDVHSTFPPSSDDAYDVPRRRRVGGWVVAFVLLLAVGVVGWVVAKPYLVARSVVGAARLDARAEAFLGDGERAMADGDLEGAQQDFDKASALAERDPRVLLDEARVAAAKADIVWLKLRLLPPDATDDARTTKAELDARVARARKAADDALSAAPEDHAAVRAEIDALRLQGDRDAARTYVSKVAGSASQPETAYVLAALDLAEPTPFWTTVIDRLRVATAGEGNAGRARAALVYALSKSGEVAGAKAELAKLDALTRPYPCLPDLHALVSRMSPRASPDRSVATNVPHIDVSALPMAPAPPSPGGAGAPSGEGMPGDQAGAMHLASQAIRKGDWGRARRIYEALVARNPTDSEALAGIGDVDRAQGDAAGAITAYQRALAVNPSYLPALLGVADTQWASGDHASARRSYKDLADRFPEGTYPSYVRARTEAPASTPAAPSATPATKPWDPGDGI
jgi:predicted Zn finger-like uncharacterized protein